MAEKTNQEIYDTMIESFNLILSDTHKINKLTYDTFGLMEPTYSNAKTIINMLDNVISKITNVENKIRSMEIQISEIQKKVR